MTKTIREWLSELPKPYRSEALENMDIEDADDIADGLGNAICEAFKWGLTKQGKFYWEDLRDKAQKGTIKAVKKSNREIAEEIWDEIHSTYGDLGFDSKKEIETILNKYL